VAKLLEVAQLTDEDSVAEVEVGRGGVEAGLDAHGLAGGDGLADAFFEGVRAICRGAGEDLGGAFGDEVELVFYGGKGHVVFKYKDG
jgi:hypothetical protein